MRKNYDWSFEKVKEAVENNQCYTETLRDLGIPTQGRNTDTLKRRIQEYGLDTSHFTFVSKNKGKEKRKSASEFLIKGSIIKPYKLKLKLLEEGIKENKCEICGITEWLGKPINCQLHHIDGDETNNELSNLQLLCPNCHSQTDNYCGSANKVEKEKQYCKECGREIKYSKSGYCPSCAAKQRQLKEREGKNLPLPTKEELEQLIYNTPFTEIGRMYEVSDACVRKWCKKFGLPYTKTQMGIVDMTPIPITVCENCGKEFKPKDRNQKFCCNECRKEFLTKHHTFDINSDILEDVLTKDLLLELHASKSWDKIAEEYNTTRSILNTLRKRYGIYKQ